MEGFKKLLPSYAHVMRDGKEKTIPAEKLVPGDVIYIKQGDKIPADIRILESNNFKVDNSSLTGETEPLLRKVECTRPDNPLETDNLAFFGTIAAEGRGKGVVI